MTFGIKPEHRVERKQIPVRIFFRREFCTVWNFFPVRVNLIFKISKYPPRTAFEFSMQFSLATDNCLKKEKAEKESWCLLIASQTPHTQLAGAELCFPFSL